MELQQILEHKQGRLKPRRRRMRPIKQSKRTEVWYRERLNSVIDEMVNVIIAELESPTLNDAPNTPPLSITAKLSRAIQKVANMSIADIANRLSFGLVNRANQQNKEQTLRTYKNAFGIDLSGMLGDGAIREDMDKAVKENVDLIKSIQTDFINDIGAEVFGNLKNGGRHENLIASIRERGKVSKSRAKFIARDQTAKLNAALTESRSRALGLDLYEWGGAGDERERDSHRKLNGKLCKYSDPAVYSDDGGKTWKKRKSIGAYEGHPGTDYQCRCVALPYVSWD
ncbi:phage minor head protein [Providencia stuartii]|uniref:phage head morphogenesis protein n=1 Tax=Providencia TaxID=586 RepID=UPI0012B59427|nr:MULTISPECIES: phage minor head protein [Providencia]MDE8745607.1 phage minor head protein [Providencia thailandensis]MDE8764282.1 phage minor head protein [Providencia thailandensis]MDE8776664.1 phage minor head protein [Providencia thailandensis]MDE8780654.1 phage minor head protein [Providencia thailandensis]MDE8784771.1 phage minor head protein [Providencia thailandensis]